MTTIHIGRWLLVTLAIAGLAFATAAVASAHGGGTGPDGVGPAADGTPPYDGTAADWAAWMEDHMDEHMGPGASEWMEAHTGTTVDERAQARANGGYGGFGMGGPGRTAGPWC